MIKVQTCYTVVCDNCKQEYEHDFVPHWPGIREARSEAEDCDWANRGEVDLCESCASEPHPFEAMEGYPLICWRCPHSAEHHDVEAVVIERHPI